MRKVLLVWAGHVCVAVGLLGVVLPLLPTTPFLLLAVACYARSSHVWHERLIRHRLLGPYLADWYARGAIPLRAKLMALMAIGFGIGYAMYSIPLLPAKVFLGLVGACVSAYILTRPN